MPITRSTPSSIELEVNGRAVRLDAQAHARGHGSPDFVVYVTAATKWTDGSVITDTERVSIVNELTASAKVKGWSLEIQ